METSVCNLVDAGDTVMVGVNGLWGERFSDMADRHCKFMTKIDLFFFFLYFFFFFFYIFLCFIERSIESEKKILTQKDIKIRPYRICGQCRSGSDCKTQGFSVLPARVFDVFPYGEHDDSAYNQMVDKCVKRFALKSDVPGLCKMFS